MVHRRRVLQAALALAGAATLTAHSPYKQWYAYRAQRLIVVASASDAEACGIADAVSVQMLAQHPESKAMSAQARSARDVVQMLRTRQLEVAVLDLITATAAYAGSVPFEREGALALCALAAFPDYLLLSLDDFPEDKAYQIAQASIELPRAAQAALRTGRPPDVAAIPFHPGALAFQREHSAQPAR